MGERGRERRVNVCHFLLVNLHHPVTSFITRSMPPSTATSHHSTKRGRSCTQTTDNSDDETESIQSRKVNQKVKWRGTVESRESSTRQESESGDEEDLYGEQKVCYVYMRVKVVSNPNRFVWQQSPIGKLDEDVVNSS